MSSEFSLGQLIDGMQENRELRRELEEQVKVLKADFDAMESEAILRLNDQNLSNARGGKATVSVKSSVVPNVKDRDAFLAYVYDNNALHLLTGAPSTPACRELFLAGELIPGLEPFTKVTLNLRTL